MPHSYYIILDNLYNLSAELKLIKENFLIATRLEETADKILTQILSEKTLPPLALGSTNFSLPRHQKMFNMARDLLSKSPFEMNAQDESLLLATFGYRLEKGDNNALV